jgi:hypothetical protein
VGEPYKPHFNPPLLLWPVILEHAILNDFHGGEHSVEKVSESMSSQKKNLPNFL